MEKNEEPEVENAISGARRESSPEEVSSQLLTIYTPIYRNLVTQLSQKAMRRLLLKLIEYPLNDKPYTSTSDIEKKTFAIGQQLIEAKFILIMNTYNENIEEMKQLAQKAKNDEENQNVGK